MQKRLIVEEFKEFLEAEQQLLYGYTRNAEDCLKELADLVYVCYQYAANLNWDLDVALDRVHQSNMSKLGEDGNDVLHSTLFILKSVLNLTHFELLFNSEFNDRGRGSIV